MTKAYEGPAIRALYAQLIANFGGYDAAAAMLGVAKSTISKQISGELKIHTEQWAEMEDAVGRYPITDMLAARRTARTANARVSLIAAVLSEIGDVPAALFKLHADGGEEQAIKEATEAHAALGALLSDLRAEAE